MDHYLELLVLPDPEFNSGMMMSALFAKLHRAIGDRKKGDIGVSFPRHSIMPGDCLRLHGTAEALHELESTNWRKGMNDYCQCSLVSPIPDIKGWRTVSRVQVKSSPQRLLRRSVRKGWLTEDEAMLRLQALPEARTTLPFVQIKSLSSGKMFRLFISHGALQNAPVEGTFSSYGLSTVATIPWF
ncbi:type I-F CRISPR-associated endoribonuclease Cas6/Csy4 [Klebsiella aerogenes]